MSAAWTHRHLIDVDILTADELTLVLDLARSMSASRAAGTTEPVLHHQTMATVFAEASTRTRTSFQLAARALGGDVVSIEAATSSLSKGESIIDTVRTLDALGVGVIAIRHPDDGAAQVAADHFRGHVVNAGDGSHAHPTQALLDLYTLTEHLGADGIRGSKICIVGDLVHSRVARSGIWALTTMGMDVWVTGPREFLAGFETWAAELPAGRRLTITDDLGAGMRGAAAVMALRVQRERLHGSAAPTEAGYAAAWGITEARLVAACPDAIVMHPGPVNVGVELPDDVASGPRSVITCQVANGVPVRMAVLALLAGTDA